MLNMDLNLPLINEDSMFMVYLDNVYLLTFYTRFANLNMVFVQLFPPIIFVIFT